MLVTFFIVLNLLFFCLLPQWASLQISNMRYLWNIFSVREVFITLECCEFSEKLKFLQKC